MRKIESLFLEGRAGRLETLIEEPEGGAPQAAAVVCHPHPQHGGTMHNKVVFRMARGLRRSGHAVLRFNYRGVNLSEGSYAHGEGELEDARTAYEAMRRRYPRLPMTLAGFSFGSRIALRLGCEVSTLEGGIRRVIAAGFPTTYRDRAFLNACKLERIFLQSTNDEYGPVPEFEKLAAEVPEPKRVVLIEASDHFFAGALDRLEAAVAELAI